MKYVKQYLLVFAGIMSQLLLTFANSNDTSIKDMTAPSAKKIPHEISIHGHTRIDNYFWLNDRKNPDVIDYLEKENAYTDAKMADYKDLQEKLFKEMTSRIKQDDESVPYFKNFYFYYTRYTEGKEYPVYCRKFMNLENPEEILLDVNKLAEGKAYCQVGAISVSPDNKLMVYGIDTLSRREYALVVQNIASGEIIETSPANTTGGASWANDNITIFYTLKDKQTLRAYQIKKHIIGKGFNDDKLVYEETDDMYNTTVYKTKSWKYLIIASYAKNSDEYRYLDANNPDGEFQLIQARQNELEYSIDHFGEYFYVHTNYNAKNFRLMRTPVTKTNKDNWEEVIPHRKDVYLQDIELFKNYLVLSERKAGLIFLRIINWETKQEHYIDVGEEAYSVSLGNNPEFDTPILRYNYSSLTTPSSVYDYNMASTEKVLKKQQEVIGDFKPSNYQAKRIYAPARDGQMIPISLVYKKGTPLDGSSPLLIYGYGSYGISIDAYFSIARLSLLDRGFIFAIAHIRGGQEMGRDWYEDGKMLKKMNTFNDFIDCTEFLHKHKYSNPEKTFAMGGSAGGLLVGAIMNMRPELYKGIVAAVPFVDVVTTMLDETVPLTTGEFVEWGNPKDSIFYHFMLSYSPYDNVKKMNYPALLVTTGLHDSQVQYWEPAKWVAKLRDYKTDNNLLLMHIDMSTGHGGASGRFQAFRDTALHYAFLLMLLGIDN